MKTRFRQYFAVTSEKIFVKRFLHKTGVPVFINDPWIREAGGGGVSATLSKGAVF